MKKETILLLVVVLAVVVLAGVIITNMQQEKTQVTTAAAPASAPSVDYQQKITMLERIVSKEPENRNAWVELGHNYFDADQPVKAIDAYDRALALDGNDPNVLTDQGIMYRRLGAFDQAIANFNKANEVNPRHHQSLLNLGVVYIYDLNDPEKGLQAWERFLLVAPPEPRTEQVRAEVESLKAMHSQGKMN